MTRTVSATRSLPAYFESRHGSEVQGEQLWPPQDVQLLCAHSGQLSQSPGPLRLSEFVFRAH
eukprot:759603-Hanusia_phi.AAC.1